MEKLHAACDECRTRKLKCSGDTPRCVRCKREKFACLYSPQKQMGRPRKRRRDDEPDESADLPTENQIEHVNSLNDPPANYSPSGFGLVSPPAVRGFESSYGLIGNGIMPPSYTDIGLGLSDTFGVSPISNLGFGVDPPIGPSLWDLDLAISQTTPLPNTVVDQPISDSCSCLSLIYLTLTELQSVSNFSFPQIIIPLRKAMSALSDLIHCPQCPKEPFSATQNIQSVVALLKAILERFNKVLLGVDAEAERLEESGQKKPYRVGDNNPALFHLHTGTLDCPMGFNIELDARDWKKISKTALRTEVYGGGSNPRPLLDLLAEADLRQARWHNEEEVCTDDSYVFHKGSSEGDRTKPCQTLGADYIRRAIGNLSWE